MQDIFSHWHLALSTNLSGRPERLDCLSGKAHKLNAKQVTKLSSPGRCADGNSIYLTISVSGSRGWLFGIVVQGGRRPVMGIVSIEEARDMARQEVSSIQELGRS